MDRGHDPLAPDGGPDGGPDPARWAARTPGLRWCFCPAFAALWRLWHSTPLTFRAGFMREASKATALPEASTLRADLAACDPMAVRACARWVAATDVTDDLSLIDAPIAASIGSADTIVPAAHRFGILRKALRAHARLFEGGHILYAEAPGEVHRMLRAWRALGPVSA